MAEVYKIEGKKTVLVMTEEETEFVYHVLGNIAGDGKLRQLLDAIWSELDYSYDEDPESKDPFTFTPFLKEDYDSV